LVEIYVGNYSSQDGLVNGADGIVKAYIKTNDIDALWFKFLDTNIEHCQARKLASLYSKGIFEDWIPIL